MNDYKLTIFTLFMLFLGVASGITIAYNTMSCEQDLSGVRGGGRTGFHLLNGEDIAIATSTDIIHEITIESNSTSTIHLRQDKSATSTGGCLIVDLPNGAGSLYNIGSASGLVSSTTDICN